MLACLPELAVLRTLTWSMIPLQCVQSPGVLNEPDFDRHLQAFASEVFAQIALAS